MGVSKAAAEIVLCEERRVLPSQALLGSQSGQRKHTEKPHHALITHEVHSNGDNYSNLGSDRANCTYTVRIELHDAEMRDFVGVNADANGVYSINKLPENIHEEALERRLAQRKVGDVWAMYEDGSGLPRLYAVLMAYDRGYVCNGRPARWKVAFLDRDKSGESATGGIGCHWYKEGRGGDVRGLKYRGVGWNGWDIANCSDDMFSHRASIAAILRTCASTRAGVFDGLPCSGDHLLLPCRQMAAVVEPKVGQIWTMSDLAKQSSDERLRGRLLDKRYRCSRLAHAERIRQTSVPKYVVLVRAINHESSSSFSHTPVEEAAFRVKSAIYVVERLEIMSEHDVHGKYILSGEIFDGCRAAMFEYQVPISSDQQANVCTGLRNAGVINATYPGFSIDPMALTLLKADRSVSRSPEQKRNTSRLHFQSASHTGNVGNCVPPQVRTCSSQTSLACDLTPQITKEYIIESDARASRERRKQSYPVCSRCHETEWNFSQRSPGEPKRGAPVMITCCECHSTWHVQCVAPEAEPGDEHDFRTAKWTCEKCRTWFPGSSPLAPLTSADVSPEFMTNIDHILRVWCNEVRGMVMKVCWTEQIKILPRGWKVKRSWCHAKNATVMTIMAKGVESVMRAAWVSHDILRKIPDEVLARYVTSPTHLNVIRASVGTSRQTACSGLEHTDTKINFQLGGNSKLVLTKRRYRFRSNGQYFGITQYLDAFTTEELKEFECCVDDLVSCNQNQQQTAGDFGRGNNANAISQRNIHVSANLKRMKIFFGYRYAYNNCLAYHRGPGKYDRAEYNIPTLYSDAPPLPNWILKICKRAADLEVIPRVEFIDMAVINLYAVPGQGLAVHIDPSSLFLRPILSARFFSESVLSFNVKGQYTGHRTHNIVIPRGSLTVMEGYAANNVTHAVRHCDVKEKSCSVIMRGCLKAAMASAGMQSHAA